VALGTLWLVLAAPRVLAGDSILVATYDSWKYLDDGSNQGTAWREASFPDSSWAEGPAPLGYGDPHVVTPVSFGADESNKYITTYFRRAFTVDDAVAVGSLRLRLLRDDGAVVYLNGTELLRDNMPTGTVGYTTLAPTAVVGSAETAYVTFQPGASALRSGTNVIAVEVHQNGATSSDLGFALELSAAPLPIREGAAWKYFKGTDYPTGWTSKDFDDASWPAGPSGFGFGDGDDNTILDDMTNAVGGYVTVFTRRAFVVENPASVRGMTLEADYDDGFVAYINGIEVARRNVNGPVSNTTTAAGSHEASRGTNGQPKVGIPITNDLAALLQPGEPSTNILAVSAHNVTQNSSDLSLIVGLDVVSGISLTRGPFLQMPDPASVLVVWRTDVACDSAVDYGLDASLNGGTVSNAALVTEHVVDLPGLLPGTQYHYRVRSEGNVLGGTNYFRTRRTPDQPFRFVFCGDFGEGDANESNVAAQVNLQDFDLSLTTGDNVYPNGEWFLYDPHWFAPYGPSLRRAPVFPSLGNHDVNPGSTNGQALLDNFFLPTNGPAAYVERNYSFDYGNAHFVALDTNPIDGNDEAAISAVTTWLSNDLAATTQMWKFAYFHHPPYTSVGRHNDSDEVKTNLCPILEAGGVQAVFLGHNHWYERINAINGVYYFVSGAGGRNLYALTDRKEYSFRIVNDQFSFSMVDIDGTRFRLQQIATNGVVIDTFNLDLGHPFKIDGLLDEASWLRADDGLKLYAAIRGPYLYVATQDAGEGGDNFVYVSDALGANGAAPWAKAGSVMQWGAFLADEDTTTSNTIAAFHGWFAQNGESQLTDFPAYQSMTSGTNNNGLVGNGVLEGTLDLTHVFGEFPATIFLAAAAFGSPDGGYLAAQAPASQDGDGNVDSSEFLVLNTRDIALDLPVASAGSSTSVLVNVAVTLNGGGSSAPSGGALSFAWTRVAGPDGDFAGGTTAMPVYTPSDFVGSTATAVFSLVVNDGRFDSDASTVAVLVKNDSDRDGLTDDEESSGLDDALTLADPSGHVTDPQRPDSDDDGMTDGDEARAGTDPNSAASVFRVAEMFQGASFTLRWLAVPGRAYQPQVLDEAGPSWAELGGPITAAASSEVVADDAAAVTTNRFYRILLAPTP
jgi:hypothetical protein